VGFLPAGIDKKFGVKTLAHQPTLHIDKAGNHSINAPCSNILFERVKRVGLGHKALVIKKLKTPDISPVYRNHADYLQPNT